MGRAAAAGWLDDAVLGARIIWGLPRLLRRRVTPEQAGLELGRRLADRGPDFLALARRAIYGSATSPYGQLLKHVGCQFGDLEALVAREGLEGALGQLHQQGVYLSVDEFKGRRPVIRGSATIPVAQRQLHNPLTAGPVSARSSGSQGDASAVPIDLAFVRDRAVDSGLVLAARGGDAWLNALWGVPGGAAVIRALEFGAFGGRPVRWFSQVDPAAAGLHPRYRWSARAIRWGSVLAGAPLPSPTHVPIDAPLPIVHWMVGALRAGFTPHLHTYASSAVRVCLAALEAGFDLHGAQFTMSSEPITSARLAVVEQAGARALPCYASMECGPIGYGCFEPRAADDLHLLDDLHALIQPAAATGAENPPAPLLITSLRPTSPLILLNVSLGDQAVLEQRPCGCPLEQLGWTRHLRTIRSFEKLTAGGMTFLDVDIVRVLEEVLPARFGGAATDYQLIEEEAEGGQPRLRLLVRPSLGPLDPTAVVDEFLAALGGSDSRRVMELQWRGAGWVQVERQAPRATANGKILHLLRQPAARPAQVTGSVART